MEHWYTNFICQVFPITGNGLLFKMCIRDRDWGKYVSALTDIGYDGCTCIEIEDKAFEDSKEKVEKSLILSKSCLLYTSRCRV